jgi:hypothetical protein
LLSEDRRASDPDVWESLDKDEGDTERGEDEATESDKHECARV